jgi:DNA polymerase V
MPLTSFTAWVGAPYFQIKHTLKQHGIVAFSSNYALYGDMSERVMTLIEALVPAVEVYSIDEAFADLTGIPELDQLGRRIRCQVLRCTGIPVGVGIAGTKTLAKLANHTAKRLQAQTGGVVNICDPFKRDWVLRNTAVSEVWGVGRRMSAHFEGMGIKTAMDLAKADPWMLRKKFSVVVEKTARELAGTPCLELDEPDPPKQEICCSRMFGKRLQDLAPIKEAVATYMMRASEKLIKPRRVTPTHHLATHPPVRIHRYARRSKRSPTPSFVDLVKHSHHPGCLSGLGHSEKVVCILAALAETHQ